VDLRRIEVPLLHIAEHDHLRAAGVHGPAAQVR
jgi:hypothetical protein